MSRNKTPHVKARLGKAHRMNRRVPLFAVAKTDRKMRQQARGRRAWRTHKLKIKSDDGE